VGVAPDPNVLRGEFEQLAAAAKFITEAAEQFKTGKRSLDRQAEDVLGGSWTGKASKLIHEGWTEWQKGFTDMMTALHDSGELVGLTADTFKRL
jgi:WXG100 family type VII secretion target